MERQLSHLLILRALAGEQIREKRFGANNSGHVELEVPSLECPAGSLVTESGT